MENCPLTGKPCPHKRVIHVTEITEYVATQQHHLCVLCGSGLFEKKKPLPPLLTSLFELIKMATTPQQLPTKPPCPGCGITVQYIIKNSRLGCGRCYEYFKNELLPVLIQSHKNIKHVGKKPEFSNLEERIINLELQLKQAIEQEQYEKAKEIKIKLDMLKSA
jgi:protein-arginine kinase activator protein McsA